MTQNLDVHGIIHIKDDEKDCPYSAVAILKVKLPPSMKNSDEICIFSQEKLTDCDELAAVIVADSKSGPLVWKYLCSPATPLSNNQFEDNGVHIFDASYLKEWVARAGVSGIQCPLCKSGVTYAKKVEEHQIDSLDQLCERRELAMKQNDLHLLFHVEQLMMAKLSEENWRETDKGRFMKNQELLRKVLMHWIRRGKLEDFNEHLKKALLGMVKKDMYVMVKVLLQIGAKDPFRGDLLRASAAQAAKFNAFECLQVVCKEGVTFNLRPMALLEAVKEMNITATEYIVEFLAEKKAKVVCDEVFTQVIKNDMVSAAKLVINNRWHKPNDRDLDLAKRIDGSVWVYLKSRLNATKSVGSIGQDNELSDGDWGDDGSGCDFSEDDDDW